jgi:hypothetical protein
LRGGAPHASKIRQIAHYRDCVLSLSLDDPLDLVELLAIPSHQDDRAVPGEFERRGAADARSRSGDDVGVAI